MSPFFWMLGNGDSHASLLSLKGDIYPVDNESVTRGCIKLLGFGDILTRLRPGCTRRPVAEGGNCLENKVIYFLA